MVLAIAASGCLCDSEASVWSEETTNANPKDWRAVKREREREEEGEKEKTPPEQHWVIIITIIAERNGRRKSFSGRGKKHHCCSCLVVRLCKCSP